MDVKARLCAKPHGEPDGFGPGPKGPVRAQPAPPSFETGGCAPKGAHPGVLHAALWEPFLTVPRTVRKGLAFYAQGAFVLCAADRNFLKNHENRKFCPR